MPWGAVQVYEIDEGSTENMWYRITVRRRGVVVEVFETETMRQAQQQLENAGYKRAWLNNRGELE